MNYLLELQELLCKVASALEGDGRKKIKLRIWHLKENKMFPSGPSEETTFYQTYMMSDQRQNGVTLTHKHVTAV